jgi:Domain of unknown function (DU1801)
MTPFKSAAVAQAFDSYPTPMRHKLLAMRELIFQTAASTQGVGELDETLKWGEPAYLTSKCKSGSTIRLGWKKAKPVQVAMYFNCQTTLIETFRTLFPADFRYEGNRALIFDEATPVPTHALRLCIAAALTYHSTRRQR